jgi:acetyl-CoA acyltransferase
MGHVPLGTGWRTAEGLGTPWPQELLDRYELVPQGIAAERVAERWEVPRSELDELGLRSHRHAARAADEGRFDRELVPVQADGRTIAADQGIRRDTSLERLAALRPAFADDGRVTAGNASQISDGAAAVLLMARETADELGVAPRARILDQSMTGVDPVLMLTGPISATQVLLERNGLTVDDVDLFEVNEAFASVVAAWTRELGADLDRVNVNGGAIALGHPLGASGARLVTTLLHELERSGGELGLVTMCCAGGLGTGTLLQRV